MTRVQDIAELLIVSWILSDDHGEQTPLPASHGLLDRALKKVMDEGAFPESWQQRLHFVDSRIGLQCVELQSVIAVAQRAEFTSEPNPSYKETRIKIGARAARALLRRHEDVSEDDVKHWGSLLREAVAVAKENLERFPPAASSVS